MLFKNDFISLLINEFPYLMTQSQEEAIEKLVDFLYKKGERRFFILRGYAGTGKTSLVSALVKTFVQNRLNIILLAPTGRSAKVFSSYANTAAYTIHKVIYSVQNMDGKLVMRRKINQLSNTLFIVDEVSMIAQYQHREDYYPVGNLLEDLVQFVFEGKNNKLIFVG
ncbi:MAG: AAA family ATPase, partial [Bacteroidales bacterium]|nr:AAA family ATPase [Bacteroidales bacterium]